jgi:hypothetical protein
MPITFVQSNIGINTTVSTGAVAYISPTTIGNLLLITLMNASGGGTLAVSDNLGHVWTSFHPETAFVGGSDSFQTWWTISKGGSVTITATASPASFLIACIGEFTWPTISAVLDGLPQFAGSAVAVSVLPNLTLNPTGTNELAWGTSVVNAGGIAAGTVNAPFTKAPTSNANEWFGYAVISAPGAIVYGGSYTGSGANGSYAIVVNPNLGSMSSNQLMRMGAGT